MDEVFWGYGAEWQDKRHKLHASLDLLDQRCENFIDDLDEALTLITKLSILYETLSNTQKRELLNNVVERVIVNLEGEIVRVNLLPPFAYLHDICENVSGGEVNSEKATKTKTGDANATCSSKVLECGSTRIRTWNQSVMSRLL